MALMWRVIFQEKYQEYIFRENVLGYFGWSYNSRITIANLVQYNKIGNISDALFTQSNWNEVNAAKKNRIVTGFAND